MMITVPESTIWIPDHGLGVAIVQGCEARPVIAAPQVWVRYDKPCETKLCVGGRLIIEHAAIDVGPCPDCRDGRQVWTVRWLDPAYYSPPNVNWLSARATIQVVPVVTESPPMNVRLFVAVGHAGCYLVDRDGQDQFILPLDPLPVPGQFAVIFKLAA